MTREGAAGRGPHVLIAGAGIGGLTAALALARVGASVAILERAPALEEAGAGVQLSPNASRVLARLGVLADLEPRAFAPRGIRVRAARSGRQLSFMPLEGARARWGAPYLVVHRADLQAALLAAIAGEAAVRLHLGAAVAGFGVTADGVTVTIRQGALTRAVSGDALIGADGVRSAVRARLVTGAEDAPLETGRTAWRTSVEAAAFDPPSRSLFLAPETGLWLGRDAHLVHYPVRGGRLVNVVAIIRESAAAAEGWSAPGDAAVIGRRFASWHAGARRLIEAAPGWTTWPLSDRRPLPAWNAGPVALLGDAAHPILPFLAQGAAQSIQDAEALADALDVSGAAAGTGSIPDALARYSHARRAQAERVQAAARSLGRIYHLAGPAALARDVAMAALGPHRLLTRYDWLYGHPSTNVTSRAKTDYV